MNYFFDTNAILIYLRDHVQKDWLDKNYDPLGDDNTAMISVVVLGELESLYLRNHWGEANWFMIRYLSSILKS
jgi:predicted nucleic acid-binding protein